MLKPLIQLYPVLPTKDEAERAALRPIGRNREIYQETLVGWHDIIRAADEMGIWGAATIEHHFWSEGYEVGPSPGTLDAYWAAITKNIRLGQLGYVMSTQNPIRVADYREVVDRIRGSGTDVVINLTTGPGARYIPSEDNPNMGSAESTMSTPQQRVRHIQELRPEVCTLDLATMNFGEHVFMNTPAHLRVMARLIREAGVVPELEVFDTGHVRLAQRLIEEGALASPPLLQICLGIPYGAPATPEAMMLMRNMLPQPCVWAGFGISRQEFPMVAQAVLLGGHVRVGLEDNLYIDQGVFAPSNAALVDRAVKIVTSMGESVANPNAARKILGLRG